MKTSRIRLSKITSAGVAAAVACAVLNGIDPAGASVLINTYKGGSIINGSQYSGGGSGSSNIGVQSSLSFGVGNPVSVAPFLSIDGSGFRLSAVPAGTFQTFNNTPPLAAQDANEPTTMWRADPSAHNVWIQYDLPAYVISLDTMNIWNESQGGLGNRSAKDVYIWYSTLTTPPNPGNTGSLVAADPAGPGPAASPGTGWTLLPGGGGNGSTLLNKAISGGPDLAASNIISFGNIPVRHVLVSIYDAYNDTGTTGFQEVQFFGAVPEPASLSLLAAGGLFMARRRR